jgi:hypothetical protein
MLKEGAGSSETLVDIQIRIHDNVLGPPRLPVWGSYWLLLLKNFKFLHIGFHKLAQNYKTKILGLYLGSFPTVVVNDYKNIREVLTRPEFQGRFKIDVLNLRTYNKSLGEYISSEL